MKFLKYIPILILALLFIGCAPKQEKNQWEDVSLKDLMPKGQPESAQKAIVGLSVFIFEVDSAKYPVVQTALINESQIPIAYSNEKSFSANSLVTGGSGIEGWEKIARSLADANASVIKRITLFMDENTSEQIEAAVFPKGTNINYLTDQQFSAAMGLPKGVVIFDINVKSLIGLKQVCRLEVNTNYKTFRKKIDDKKLPAWQYAFDSVDFSLPFRQGQFIIFGPRIENNEKANSNILPTLGEMIFTNSQYENRMKFCLIVCGLIKD
ncbi:MAG: hypothetical protein ABFD79_15110 [Phycisphaerales bacterium]